MAGRWRPQAHRVVGAGPESGSGDHLRRQRPDRRTRQPLGTSVSSSTTFHITAILVLSRPTASSGPRSAVARCFKAAAVLMASKRDRHRHGVGTAAPLPGLASSRRPPGYAINQVSLGFAVATPDFFAGKAQCSASNALFGLFGALALDGGGRCAVPGPSAPRTRADPRTVRHPRPAGRSGVRTIRWVTSPPAETSR